MNPENQWTLCTGKKKKVRKFQTLQLDQPPDTCSTSMRQSQEVKGLARQCKKVEDGGFSTPQLALPHVEIDLLDKSRRAQILKMQLAKFMEFNEIASDVDFSELIAWTKNFTAAEIEDLVQAAKRKALSPLIKMYPKVEIDPHLEQKFKVCRSDFFHALNHEIKPAFKNSDEELAPYIPDGIIYWGDPVESFFANGTSLIQKALSERSGSGLFTLLVEGPPKAGKTAITAQLAKDLDFPFIRICSPANMAGLSETEKCAKIRKDFNDAYYSESSCIFIDNIEFLMEYREIGTPYSKVVLQTFLELFKKSPPDGRKLVVLCTTSCRQKLEKMDILPRFNAVLEVPFLSTVEHLTSVLEETKILSDSQIAELTKKMGTLRPKIGIQKLLWIISLAKLIDDNGEFGIGRPKEKFPDVENRIDFLFWKLEFDGFLV